MVGGRTAGQERWHLRSGDVESGLLQHVGQQENGVAVRAMAAQAKCAAEGIAVPAALLSNGVRFTRWAFVHGVLGELSTTLQFCS